MNIALGSIVISINMSLRALSGSNTNWDYGISKPSTADIKGILNVLLEIGILLGRMTPFIIWHWGTVGEIKGYRTPLEKLGEYKWLNPEIEAKFGIE